MRYALTAVRSDIGYNPVSVGEPLLLCHLGDDSEDIAYQFTVGSIHCIHRLDMLLGNRQIHRSYRVNILEYQNPVILVYLCGRDLPCRNLTIQ